MMTAVQDILSEYSFEEPDKCNWSDYLAIQKNSVAINSVAMCGWLDFIDLFKAICTKLSEDYHDEFFEGESEYTNISTGYKYYMGAKYDENGLEFEESTICCEYCGCPIFGEDIIFIRNEDEGIIALCSDDCKESFMEEYYGDEEDWEESSYEEYEAENGF